MKLPIDFLLSDQKAANTIAAEQARRDGMPHCADRHDAFALALENAVRWAQANCPEGYRTNFTLNLEFIPNINAVYNGDRDIYSHNKD